MYETRFTPRPPSSTTVDAFAAEYHDLKARSDDGKRRALSLAGVAPWPPLLLKEEKPQVIYWVKDFYLRASGGQHKGDTDGDGTTVATKNKAGRPRKNRKSGISDEELGIEGETHKHVYLEKEDGKLISVLELRALSQKARGVWEDLLNEGHAPKTWGKISSVAWEYYARNVLNEPGLEFLRFCEEGQWKLREWSQLNYSGWAKRRGIRGARANPKKEATDKPLDDTDLIRMEPIDGEEQDDIDIEESAPTNLDDIADLGLGTSDDEETHAAAETPPPTVFSSLLPFFACPSHTRLTLGSHPCEIGCD